MNLLIVWRDTRGKVAVTLIILWVATLVYQFSFPSLLFPSVAVVLSAVFDILLVKVRYQKDVFSLSSVVTGLLIGLILTPRSGVGPLLVACGVASFTKQFFGRGPHRHIFNPAAIGLVVSSVITGGTISWWAAAWGYIPSAIIVTGMVIALRQLHRLWLPVLFLVSYFVVFLLSSSLPATIALTLDGTVLLFAFVMLPEPMTSVLFGRWRYFWGVLVAMLVLGENILRISWSDPLLLALLAANAVGFFFIRTKFLSYTA